MDMSDVKILATARPDEPIVVRPKKIKRSNARMEMDKSVARANELLSRRKTLRKKRKKASATETVVEVASVVAVIGTVLNVMFEVADHIRR